jgi:WD40 repeat protein
VHNHRNSTLETVTEGAYDALPLEGVSLALVGDAGVGKSYMMAKLADEIFKKELGIEFVIIRFVGSSEESSTGIGLLHSINAQIHYLLGKPYHREAFYTTYEEVVKLFQSLMQDYAIILFLDGVDSLNDENFARTHLSFLKGIILHPSSRIVLSTRPDHHDLQTNRWVSYYGCDSRLRDSEVIRERIRRFQITNYPDVEVDSSCYEVEDADEREVTKAPTVPFESDPFEFSIDLLQSVQVVGPDVPPSPVVSARKGGREEALTWIRQYLGHHGRSLAPPQWTDLMLAAAKDPRIVNIKLLCDIFLSVRSFDPYVLPTLTTFETGIAHFVDAMKLKYGHEIVSGVVRYLTFAVRGLTDNEMIDLLSLDDAVLLSVTEIVDFSVSGNRRFPAHIWYRIRQDLMCCLRYLEDGCLTWSNRSIRDAMLVAHDAYVTREAHKLLACYFGNLVDDSRREGAQVLKQPLYHNSCASIWSRYPCLNRRRCSEAGKHLLGAEMFSEAMAEFCDIEAVCARARCGMGYSFLSQIVALENKLQHPRIEHYTRWLSHSMFKIMADPRVYLVMTCSQQPLVSTARRDMLYLLYSSASSSMTSSCDFSKDAWIRCVHLGGPQDFGALLDTLQGHSHRVTGVSWSVDGSMLLSCSWDKSVCIWNAQAATLLGICEGHGAAVTSVTWNPDSLEFASASWDNTVAVWDVHSGQVIQVFEEHQDFVCAVAWSPNQQYIASGSYDQTIRIWPASGLGAAQPSSSIYVLEGHDNWVACLAWSPDSSLLASGSFDHKVMLWMITYGTWKQTYVGHSGAIISIAWSPSGTHIASGSLDKTIVLWSVSKDAVDYIVHELTSPINSIAWHPDSERLAIGCTDRVIRVWNCLTRLMEGEHAGHTDSICSVGWSSNGTTLVSASADHSVCLWDSASLNQKYISDCHSASVTRCLWSPDDRYIASCSVDGSILLWDAQYGKLVSRLFYHNKDVIDICWSPDCLHLLSCSLDGKCVTWDCSSSLPYRVDRFPDKTYFSAVAWSRQVHVLAMGTSSGPIRIVNFHTGSVTKNLNGHNGSISTLQFSPVNFSVLVSGSKDTTVCVWDAQDAVLQHQFNGHKNWVTSVQWHPNGSMLASASLDKTIRLWNIEKEKQLEEGYSHSEAVTFLCWHQDGQRIAFASSDKYVHIWNSTLAAGTVPFALRGHGQEVNAVDWNQRGTKLISCSADQTIRIWDAVKMGSTVDREIELLQVT